MAKRYNRVLTNHRSSASFKVCIVSIRSHLTQYSMTSVYPGVRKVFDGTRTLPGCRSNLTIYCFATKKKMPKKCKVGTKNKTKQKKKNRIGRVRGNTGIC